MTSLRGRNKELNCNLDPGGLAITAPRLRSGTVEQDDFPFRLRRNSLFDANRPPSVVEGLVLLGVYIRLAPNSLRVYPVLPTGPSPTW